MTLFVGGVHAVGKTYVLTPACKELAVRHASASQLIKEQRGLSNWTVSRQVDGIDENQKALVEAVRRIEQGGDSVVLDGHFVLRRGIDAHEKIGVDTFHQLLVSGVILLEAPSSIIADRLVKRGDTTWSIQEIEIFAQKESDHAEFVCQSLGIPLVRLEMPSEVVVRNAVASLLG